MTRHQLIAALFAGAGFLIVIIGNILDELRFDSGEVVRQVGLLAILTAAIGHLAVNYSRRRRRVLAASPVRIHRDLAGGLRATAANLVFAGTLVFASSLALLLVFHRFLPPHSLLFWVLGGFTLLGAGATFLGGLGWVIAILFVDDRGMPQETREGPIGD